MPVFVNVGYPPSPDGKEWKHMSDCSVLAERAASGYPIRRLTNRDTGKRYYVEHKRRRCPLCMSDSMWPESEPHNREYGRKST